MKNLLIIGARGYGREVCNNCPDYLGYGTEFVVKGFLDDKSDALDAYPGYPPIIDSCENYVPQEDDVFICALGSPHYRKIYAEMLLDKGAKFINLIHRTAFTSKNLVIGKGCIIGRNVSISCEIIIKDFVCIQSTSNIGHDAKIGSYCHLNSFTFMGGFAELGDEVTLSTGAIILPHMQVGSNSVVGAGSVVIRKVKAGSTVYGNPAIQLKY